MRLARLVPTALILGLAIPVHLAQSQDITALRIASGNGIGSALYVTAPPGDTTRLFIVRQNGIIRILDLTVNPPVLLPGAFLDIDAISQCCGERGLLGLAFHPSYASNGFFYVNYTNNDGDTIIARYTVSSDANVADAESEVILKFIEQPFANHNGGCLQFGPDGFLYAAMGDGGSGGDPMNFAQNPASLLGKMLRLDVDNPPTYVAAGNPYEGEGDPLDEIWAFGLRNPWRFSFDRANGDLYLGDVGQGAREEIDYTPAGSTGGENYGWRCYEGNLPFNLAGCLPIQNYDFPIHDYAHMPMVCNAVTGGYVYRGTALPGLQGTYFFADYCRKQIWSFRVVDGAVTEFQERTAQLDPPCGTTINTISSFGEDAAGELYIVDIVGQVFKIVPGVPPLTLVAAAPADQFYDAREDLHNSAPAGVSSLGVLFSGNTTLCAGAFDIDCGAAEPCPVVASITGSGPGPYAIAFDRPIPPGVCTTITVLNTIPPTPLHYRFLPGDANANGVANTQDLLALIQALNSGAAGGAANLYDMNRSGAVDTQDLLRLIQLLNGVESTQVWNGVGLTACP